MTSTATHRIRVLGAVLALIVSAAIAVAALQPPAARPQPAPKREMLQVTVVKIKPDLVDQWLEFQKNETIPMLRKAGVKSRDAWTTATFGDGFTYGFVTPIEN